MVHLSCNANTVISSSSKTANVLLLQSYLLSPSPFVSFSQDVETLLSVSKTPGRRNISHFEGPGTPQPSRAFRKLSTCTWWLGWASECWVYSCVRNFYFRLSLNLGSSRYTRYSIACTAVRFLKLIVGLAAEIKPWSMYALKLSEILEVIHFPLLHELITQHYFLY